MLYKVDFYDRFYQTIHTALIFAQSVTECKQKAAAILNQLGENLLISIEEAEA